MAGSEEDSIRNLFKADILREADLRDIVEKLLEDKLSVHTLITMSDSDLDDLIRDYFPVGSSRGAKLGFKTAIRRKKKLSHASPSGSHVYAEGARPSKMAKRSRKELERVELEARTAAKERYYRELLAPPPTLPRSADELWEFLSLRPVPLPVSKEFFESIRDPELVVLETSAAEKGLVSLASFCETVLGLMKHSLPWNEATSSHELAFLTGNFLSFLNDEAPANGKLKDKTDAELLDEALVENTSKLKAWSPLFYGKLPYVIGGGCGGRQFQWLKLYPHGKEIIFERISERYDLNVLSDVVKFLHSTIRMHCLLQKLQEELDDAIRVALYKPRKRSDFGVVTIYPDFVSKEILRSGKESTTIKSLYDSIAGSRYLIQLLSVLQTRARILLQLQPVGDPFAKPKDFKDLENATHDMLRGLADLHKEGYTHRDLRWDNVIKVNDKGDWKWVIIDLEAAGPDNEVWVGEGLTSWDAETLEEDNDKRQRKMIRSRNRYTKGSDMYQLGKLIAEWLDDFSVGGNKERQVMRSRAKKMQQERIAAAKMLEDVCKKRCERCRMFSTKLQTN